MNSIKPAPIPVKSLEEIGRECAKLALQVASLHYKDAPQRVQQEIESANAHLLAAKSLLFRAQWISDASPSMVEVG